MKHKKLILGTIILTIANFITRGMGFFHRIFLSSVIGAEGIGLYQLILPLYGLTWSITAAGFTTTISRLTAKEHLQSQSGNIARVVHICIALCIGISIAISTLLFFCSGEIAYHIVQEPRTALSLRLLAFAIPFMAIGSCLRGYFMGLQKMIVPACSQVLEQVLRIGTIWILADIFVPKGIEYACFAAICGVVLGEFGAFLFTYIQYIYTQKQQRPLKVPTISHIAYTATIVSIALPLTATRITSSVLSAIENLLIPRMLTVYGYSNADALSTYGELTGMVMPLLMLPSVLLMACSISLVPELSEACEAKQQRRIQRTVSATLLFTAMLGIGTACVFAVFPKEICYIFYGRPSLGELLFPLAFLCPMLYGQMTINGILNGLGEQFFLFWSHIVSSLVAIAFVLFGVPQYGIPAFYMGWFVSLFVATVLSLHRLHHCTKIKFHFYTCFFKPALAGGAAALLARLLIQTGTPSPLFFVCCLGFMGICYILFLYLLGCFQKEHVQYFLRK